MAIGTRSRRASREENGAQPTRWVSSACGLCYSQCAIRVKVRNGVIMKIEGNPDSPAGSGRLCPKGVSGIMTMYDPNRVDVPLMRTNPEKGLGVDPGWKEISWEEASRVIVERLRKIRSDDPRKLAQIMATIGTTLNATGWLRAFGSPNMSHAGGGLHCGNGAHLTGGFFHAAWSLVPDWGRCDYAILFGASKGHSAGHAANANAQMAAEARARGLQMVVVDPMCNFAASKATEWVPIRPGTDAALALGMVNIILNEMGVWDAPYLQRFTNAPYLIRGDGNYLRDSVSGKPLVWDGATDGPRAFDDLDVVEPAILGTFWIGGEEVHPAFQLMKEHAKKYTPAYVEKITSVPAPDVRRLAHEFASHARVGATVEIDGHRLPLRPAAAIYFRGAQGHKNAAANCLAVEWLNEIVGAADVPGGALGFNPAMFSGYEDSGKPSYAPYAGPDGLLVAGHWVVPHKPYPVAEPKIDSLLLTDAWPMSMPSASLYSQDQEEIWSGLGLPYRPEMLINFGSNTVMTVGNPATAAAALTKIPFMVSFDLFLTEFSELCDIVLPDTCYLERFDVAPHWPPLLAHPPGPGSWGWHIRQPAVEPVPGRRDFQEVLLEWAYEAGFGDDYHSVMNQSYPITEPWALEPGRRYTWEEICDRRLKSMFGEDHDLAWFREYGVLTWPKTTRDVYWRYFVDARVPVYFEPLKALGVKQRAMLEEAGWTLPIDWSRFEPLPDWRPCPSHEEQRAELDLWAFYYRDVIHTNSFTYENPWLDEVSQENPFSYAIAISPKVAEQKGLKTGDRVVVESRAGRQARGRVYLTEAIHPETIGIAGCGGHFTKSQPIAFGKGTLFNELIELDWDHMDPVTLGLDLCVKVRVYPEP